jgi:hypothetical protein
MHMLSVSDVIAGVALLVSGYNLWQTKLKGAHLRVFVPPVIQYSSPYQNSKSPVAGREAVLRRRFRPLDDGEDP